MLAWDLWYCLNAIGYTAAFLCGYFRLEYMGKHVLCLCGLSSLPFQLVSAISMHAQGMWRESVYVWTRIFVCTIFSCGMIRYETFFVEIWVFLGIFIILAEAVCSSVFFGGFQMAAIAFHGIALFGVGLCFAVYRQKVFSRSLFFIQVCPCTRRAYV